MTNTQSVATIEDDLHAVYKQYGALRYSELSKLAETEGDNLIQGFLPAGQLGILVGEWGLGKSPFATQMAMTLSIGGLRFLDVYETKVEPTKSLYVDFENGAKGTEELGVQIAKFLGSDSPPETALVYSPNYSPKSPSGLEAQRKHVYQLIRKAGIGFVVIDPLRMWAPQAESDNSKAANTIKGLRALASKTGATILLVHHPRKSRLDEIYSLETDPPMWFSQASGASSLIQNVDFRIGLQKDSADHLLLRHYQRLQGWGPLHRLVRVLDDDGEPIGFRLEGEFDQLTPAEKEEFTKLPSQFRTGEARKLLDFTQNPMNKRLNDWASLGLIRKVARGEWEKTDAGLGKGAKQGEQTQ